MANLIEVEVVVIVDGDGNWVVSHDQESALEKYGEEYTDDGSPRRTIRVTLKVPVPAVVELTAEIPEEAAAGELKVA
jgi:hypothetical protein